MQGLGQLGTGRRESWSSRTIAGNFARFGREGVGAITVDRRLSGEVLRMLRGAAPTLGRAMDKHMSSLAFKAWREWPVASGVSKAALGLEFMIEAGGRRYRSRITERAPYVFFIKGAPHRRLIDDPAKTIVPRMMREGMADLEKLGRAP